MIVRRELISKLKDFGLNSYESKLWTALLSRGVSTAGELSDISNVPRSRAYDVLESLEKKGFIIVKLGKPIKYLAVPPREVVDRVKKRIAEEAERRAVSLEELKDSDLLEDLNVLHKDGIEKVDPTEKSGSFRGRDKLYDHLSTMIKNSKSTVSIMTTAAGLQRKLDYFKSDFEKAAKRGVKIRIAAPLTNDVKKNAPDWIELKHVENPVRFCTIDGKELILMLRDDKDVNEAFDSAIWVSTPYFVNHFDSLFQKQWDSLKS